MAVACFVLVGVGVLLILLGTYMSLKDWKDKRDATPVDTRQSLDKSLEGLTKLADAIKGYPIGQQLIVWGIVIIIIGGLFGGVAGLTAAK
jgi:hypothetical protein